MSAHTRASAFAIRHPRATSAAGMSVLLLAFNLSAADTGMPGDAGHYWALARTFTAAGPFSFEQYVDRLRGYSLPVLLHGVQQAALALHVNEVVFFRIVSALIGAALFAIALPAFFTRVLNVRPALPTTAAFCLLGFLYWHGHLSYSLSDFPTLLLLTMGLLCLPASADGPWRSGAALTSGGCLALAANARPVYETALLGAFVLVCWYAMRTSGRRAAMLLTAFVVGAVLVLLPQAAINSRTFGTQNPLAHGPSTPGQSNLFVQQIGWGIAIQRYETNVGTGSPFPVAVMFLDPEGHDLLALPDRSQDPRALITRMGLDARAYVRLVAAHPVFFALAYGRHLFNGLDIAYPTPYVTRLVPRSAWLALANYIILAVSVAHAVMLIRRVRLREHAWPLALGAIFVLPALPAIPTAIEPRFLLPLWVLVYGFFVFRLLGEDGWRALVRPRYAAAAATGVLLGFMLASATYAQILGAPLSFDVWCLWCV